MDSVPRCLATANSVGAFISAVGAAPGAAETALSVAEPDDRSDDSAAPTSIGPNPAEALKRLPIWRGTEFSKLSVPLEMMLIEGSIRRARTDWPSGAIARGAKSSTASA